MLSEIFIQVG